MKKLLSILLLFTSLLLSGQTIQLGDNVLNKAGGIITNDPLSTWENTTNKVPSADAVFNELNALIIGNGASPTPNEYLTTGGETTWDIGTPITNSHQFFANGLIQTVGVDYTYSGSVITYLTTISAGEIHRYDSNVSAFGTGAISSKTTKATLDGTEEVIIEDVDGLKKTTTQAIADLGGGSSSIDWQGTWVSGNYVIDQAVSYNGSSYICKLNTVSNEIPTNTTYWDLMAQKGDTGATGATGTAGTNGVGYAYHLGFTDDRTVGNQYIPLQSIFYDPITSEMVVNWANSNMRITSNLTNGFNKFLTSTNNEIRLTVGNYAYILESELVSATNVNVYIAATSTMNTAGRIPIMVRPTVTNPTYTIAELQGVFADYMKDRYFSYLDKNNEFYELGKSEKIYTPSASKYGIIAWGDSILDGRVPQADADTWLNQTTPSIPNALMYNESANAFQTFQLGLNTGAFSNTTSQWGWDMEVYHKLQTYLTDDIYIVKKTQGATDMKYWWNPDFNQVDTAGGFTALLSELEKRIKKANKVAQENGITVDWRAMLISMGTNDTPRTESVEFEKNLFFAINYIRGVVGNPKLKVIIPLVSPSGGFDASIANSIKRMSQKDPYIYFTPTTTGGMITSVHPDATLSIAMGEQVYQVLKDFKQDVVKRASTKTTYWAGTQLDLTNKNGVLQNFASSATKSSTTYTLSGTLIEGAKNTALINASTQPIITGATYRTGFGDAFVSSTDMIMKSEVFNGTVKYWFEIF